MAVKLNVSMSAIEIETNIRVMVKEVTPDECVKLTTTTGPRITMVLAFAPDSDKLPADAVGDVFILNVDGVLDRVAAAETKNTSPSNSKRTGMSKYIKLE